MATKKTIFKKYAYSYVYPLQKDSTFSDCCGATFKSVDPWSMRSYTGADGASGKGIILSDEPPNIPLTAQEQTTQLHTRNGTIYLTTKHP